MPNNPDTIFIDKFLLLKKFGDKKREERLYSSHPIGLDVHFDVDVPPHLTTPDHTDRDFGGHGTVLNDMGHDGTAL